MAYLRTMAKRLQFLLHLHKMTATPTYNEAATRSTHEAANVPFMAYEMQKDIEELCREWELQTARQRTNTKTIF